MRRLFANANYNFLNFRRTAYIISASFIALGVAGAIFFEVNRGSWLRYGVDFAGGTETKVELRNPDADLNAVRSIVTAMEPQATVNSFGGANEFQVRTPVAASDEAATVRSDRVVAALQQEFGQDAVIVNSTDAISAKVGDELQGKALLAIIISLAATLIYIAFRFEWRFGVAAVIATAHDVIFTLCLLVLLQLEISLPTVAAVLTIVGYSLNDTIIIFDRIRENLRGSKREDFIGLLNRSINETLPRTVLTSGTTLMTLLALYLFGGMVIRDFALILIMGILLGTYSSVFIAAPALLEIEKRYPHEVKQVRRSRSPAATRA